MMYIYDYNLQFFFSYGNYLFGQNFKILIETYRTLLKFSLLNTYLCFAWAPHSSANSVWRACPVFQNVRWRFFVVNDTFHQGIAKPSIFALRACFTETLSIWLTRKTKSKQKFRQLSTKKKIKAICTTKSSF